MTRDWEEKRSPKSQGLKYYAARRISLECTNTMLLGELVWHVQMHYIHFERQWLNTCTWYDSGFVSLWLNKPQYKIYKEYLVHISIYD